MSEAPLNQWIQQSILESQHTIGLLTQQPQLMQALTHAIHAVIRCFKQGNKVLFAGNGGSAADAQHMSAEFVSRFMFNRPGLPSIALTTDTSALTAIGNDYGYDLLFSRQIQALGQQGDVFIAYSTSGSSPNIIKGLEQAKCQQMTTIALTGNKASASEMLALSDIALQVPSQSTPRIQEGHLLLGHLLCGAVEEILFGKMQQYIQTESLTQQAEPTE